MFSFTLRRILQESHGRNAPVFKQLSDGDKRRAIDMLLRTIRSIASLVRRCECGAVFLKTHKQLYCSVSCQKRFYMRRFRKAAKS